MRRPFTRIAAAILALTLTACAPRGQGPALWRIADADSEIWLFGTVHVLPRGLNWRTARIDAAFAAADVIVFETDIEPGGQEAFAALVRQHGALPSGQTLAVRLGPESAARLARVARGLRVDPNVLQQTRPWLAALQLSLAFAERAGADPASGVETVLGAEARAAGKPIAFLETPEAQIRALADLSPQAETDFLRATLRQIEAEAGENDALDRAWVNGDTRALARQLDQLLREAGPEAHAAIITTRNQLWADQIADMLAGEGDIFIAVGAAHLVGEDSVIALLRARGVVVEGP